MARSSMSALPKGVHASRTPSDPAPTVPPAPRGRPPGGAGALGDHADLLGALLARVVQVDVHAGAVAARDAEDRVQLAAGVAVDAEGVHSPDQLGSLFTARSSRSAVPGRVTTPLCGKATT